MTREGRFRFTGFLTPVKSGDSAHKFAESILRWKYYMIELEAPSAHSNCIERRWTWPDTVIDAIDYFGRNHKFILRMLAVSIMKTRGLACQIMGREFV